MSSSENSHPLQRVLDSKLFRFAMGGGLVAAINIGAVWALLQWPVLGGGELGQNLAHILGTEFALLCSFHIHNYWTWQRRSESYWRKLWEFHAVTGFTIGLRIVIFFLLNRVGVHPLIATLAGIGVAVVLNFLGYDKIVFKKHGRPADGDEREVDERRVEEHQVERREN